MEVKRVSYVLLISIFLMSIPVWSQFNRGDHHFQHGEYAKAAVIYKKQHKRSNNDALLPLIADCYFQIMDYSNAERYYSIAMELADSLDPKIALRYAEVLKYNSKHSRSKDIVVVYATPYAYRKFEMDYKTLQRWENAMPLFEVNSVEGINTSVSEFGAFPYENGFIFTTEKPINLNYPLHAGRTNRPYYSMFYAQKDSVSSEITIKPMSANLNSDYHDGPICFNADETEAYFTRVVYEKKGKEHQNKPQIYMSTKTHGKWKIAVPFAYNQEGFASAHPSLSNDGKKLYFVSDRKGGYGKNDIYYCERNANGTWGLPINLGGEINTEKNEMFPFSYNDSILYFSSDGHFGYGGLDVFRALSTSKNTLQIENLKTPINSHRDDFSIVFFDSISGYFASNRKEGKGSDDVYSFVMITPGQPKISITGVFMYSALEPARFSELYLYDEDQFFVSMSVSNEIGEFQFDNLDANKNYEIVVDSNDVFLTDESAIFITNTKGSKVLKLAQNPDGYFVFHTLPMDDFSYLPVLTAVDEAMPFGKIFGQLYSELPGDLPSGMTIYLMDDNGEIIYTAVTDAYGNFIFEQLPPDGNYTIRLGQELDNGKIILYNKHHHPVALIEINGSKFAYELLAMDQASIDLLGITDFPMELKTSITLKMESKNVPKDGLLLLDKNKRMVSKVQCDKNGFMVIHNLNPYDNYFLYSGDSTKIEEENGLVENIFMCNSKNEKIQHLLQDAPHTYSFQALTEDEINLIPKLEANLTSDIVGKVYQKLPGDIPQGLKVFLLNDQGDTLQTTDIGPFGRFHFRNITQKDHYIFAVENHNLNRVFSLYDNKGQAIRLYPHREKYQFYNKVDLKGRLDHYAQLPKAGVELELLDKGRNSLARFKTDSLGQFQIKGVRPNNDYTIVIRSKDLVTDPKHTKMYLTNTDYKPVQAVRQEAYDYFRFYAQSPEAYNAMPVMGSENKIKIMAKVFRPLNPEEIANLKVEILNKDGIMVYTTYTDRFGYFGFNELPFEPGATIRIQGVEDGKIIVYDQYNNALAEVILGPNGFEYKLLAMDQASITLLKESHFPIGFTSYVNGQFLSSKQIDFETLSLVLKNKKGNTITPVRVDQQGHFHIDDLELYSDYTITSELENEKLDLDYSAVFLLNADGDKVYKLYKEGIGSFSFKALSNDEYNLMPLIHAQISGGLFGKMYDKLPGDIPSGTKIMMLNDKGEVIQVAVVDVFGNFFFEELPSDGKFSLKVEADLQDANLMVLDKQGKQYILQFQEGLMNLEKLAPDWFEMQVKENLDVVMEKDFYGRVYEKLPGDLPAGMKVFLLNDAGEIIAEAIINAKGEFVFDKLPSDQNYTLKVAALDNSQLTMLQLNADGTEQLAIGQGNKGQFDLFKNQPTSFNLKFTDYNNAVVVSKNSDYLYGTLLYQYDESLVDNRSRVVLQNVITVLKNNPQLRVELFSHTDSKGSDQYNFELSVFRARNVESELIKYGISPQRIHIIGLGESKPVAPNTRPNGADFPEGRQKNRRTDVYLKLMD